MRRIVDIIESTGGSVGLIGLGLGIVFVVTPHIAPDLVWPLRGLGLALMAAGLLSIVIKAVMMKKRQRGPSIGDMTIEAVGPFADTSTAIEVGKGGDLSSNDLAIKNFGRGIVHHGEGKLDLNRTEITRDAKPYSGVARNDPCPCGSGKKFKKCHGKDAVA